MSKDYYGKCGSCKHCELGTAYMLFLCVVSFMPHLIFRGLIGSAFAVIF